MRSRVIPDASMGNTKELPGDAVAAMMAGLRICLADEGGPSAAAAGLNRNTYGTAKAVS
jgi:hypothetical protein